MKTYIAVTEVHARPDLKKPVVITKAGHPFEVPEGYDVSDLVKGGALREPTEDEVKVFQIEDAKPAKKAAAADTKKADADTKKAEADAKKAAEDAKKDNPGEAQKTDGGAGDDDANKLV